MSHSLILKPQAEVDLQEALDWYEAQRMGLGLEFVEEIQETLHRITENPYLYPVVWLDIRRAITQRFPYGVFYILENDIIWVLAVFHASRDPALWRERR